VLWHCWRKTAAVHFALWRHISFLSSLKWLRGESKSQEAAFHKNKRIVPDLRGCGFRKKWGISRIVRYL
jgi:hypothetical protein